MTSFINQENHSYELQSLQKNLTSLKNSLSRLENDNLTLNQIADNLKISNDSLRKDKDLQTKKVLQLSSEKSDFLLQIESLNHEYETSLAIKQAEIDKLQQKIFGSEQNSSERTLRKRLEYEIPYRLEIESKEIELDKMKDLCNNMIRENESLKVRLESMRYDWENEVRTLKNRYRIETNELKLHVTALQPDKEYEKSSSDVIRESKREIQDLKKRLHEKEELVSRLRKDKTDLMDSRFEQCESLKKMLDLEKLEKRNIMIENERLNTQETKNNDKNSNAKGSVYEFWEKPEEFEEILLYHEKKYENVLRDKQIKDYKYDIEAREIKEMIRKKESQLKEKEKICEKLGKEKEEIEKRALENGLEVERIKEENFGFLDKINKLKEENQVLNQKFQEIGESKVGLEELTKQKEKTRQYKEKLKEANEKIMSLLEEKIKTKENNEVKTEKKEKGIEKSTFVPEERLNNRDFMKDLTNMRILDENRIIRENANRFKEHLLMMN